MQTVGLPPMQVHADMAKMIEEGINSFKFFLAYKDAVMVRDELYLDGVLPAAPCLAQHANMLLAAEQPLDVLTCAKTPRQHA